MIDFEIAPLTEELRKMSHKHNENFIRNIVRYYDDYEHEHDEFKDEEIQAIRDHQAAMAKFRLENKDMKSERMGLGSVILGEEGSWGAPMFTGGASRTALGNAAINAVATKEQKERFGKMHAAMAITEPCCGSDTASIQATAKLDVETNEWILNGEKIFVTAGNRCECVVVWATLDRSQGRPAIKSFVVEKSRPGITVSKLEHKLGIRASDTASIILEDCRIPYDNILGSPEIQPKGGFKGVMATFDATRPAVAAMALGTGRAALDFTKEKFEEEGFTFPYDRSPHELSAIQKDILDMEAQLDVSRLLIWRAGAMLDSGQRNSLEASSAKAKAGKAAGDVCQKCVALLGPLGYSREWLAEKFMRDCKITDLFEGTGQINMLVVARLILGFKRDMLK